jgi:hypothetical protein
MSSNHVVIESHFLARLLSRGGEAELLSAADRLDIMDLVNTVGWCIDACSYEVLAQIITEKFQLDMPDETIDGRANFIEFLKNGKTFQGLRHQNTNILMRSIDLANAIAVSHLSLIKVTNQKSDGDDNKAASGGGFGNGSGMGDDALPAIVIQAVCLQKEPSIRYPSRRHLSQTHPPEKTLQ